MTGAPFTTTTEVYPDSAKTSPQECTPGAGSHRPSGHRICIITLSDQIGQILFGLPAVF